jgi:hypothetical protein
MLSVVIFMSDKNGGISNNPVNTPKLYLFYYFINLDVFLLLSFILKAITITLPILRNIKNNGVIIIIIINFSLDNNIYTTYYCFFFLFFF